MAISEPDIKKLWGMAAGLCSFPGCKVDCLQFVDPNDPTVLGEMGHVIAKDPNGPRGRMQGGPDSYANLILLCPTHHTLVDKAHEQYPEDMLLAWKSEHEGRVRSLLASPSYSNKNELCAAIHRLLIENHSTWATYGPESDIARRNPFSNVASLWMLRKLSEVIPNNTRIVNMIRSHKALVTPAEYRTCTDFIEHAAGFEKSAYDRLDDVPRFPKQFEEMIRDGETK